MTDVKANEKYNLFGNDYEKLSWGGKSETLTVSPAATLTDCSVAGIAGSKYVLSGGGGGVLGGVSSWGSVNGGSGVGGLSGGVSGSSGNIFTDQGSMIAKINADGSLEGDFNAVVETNATKAMVNLAKKHQALLIEHLALQKVAKEMDAKLDHLIEILTQTIVKNRAKDKAMTTSDVPDNPIFAAIGKMHRGPNAPDASVMENCGGRK